MVSSHRHAVSERRSFLAAVAATLAMGASRTEAGSTSRADTPTPLRMLILGGTGFTGPHQVRYALSRGHKITLLNRNTRSGMFEGQVEKLIGDLNGDVSAVAGRTFDVVIDNPTTFPAWVRNAAQYLKGNTRHYIFVSTISVYADNATPGQDETAAILEAPAGIDPYTLVPEHMSRHYGELKAYAEREVERQYPGLSTIIRPGLIAGPGDQTDRFTYWPVRLSKGGHVLAPGAPSDPTQFIDARDLAEWTIRLAEQRAVGIYNAVGPERPLAMGSMLYEVRQGVGGDAQFTWVPADFLRAQDVHGWVHMPAWVPSDGAARGLLTRSNARARARGLKFRPVAVTARETLAWHRTRPAEEQARVENAVRAGLSAARESDVLAAWAIHAGKKP